MTQHLFGTDGIRDIANSGHLTPDNLLKIARIIGYTLRTNPQFFWVEGSHAPDRRDRSSSASSLGAGKVALGCDTRLSGPLISSAVRAGLLSQGVDIIDLGVAPTPVVASLANRWGCVLGVVISASHNPMEYNGIKLFNARSLKLPAKTEAELEQKILTGSEPVNYPIGDRIGRCHEHPDYFDEYVALVTAKIGCTRASGGLRGVKLVLDGANGAASQLAPRLFEQLGADLITINCEPDGRNINRDCGALHPEAVREVVLKEKAALGIALDGDADRAILVDETGAVIDGDFMLAIAAKTMKEQGTLTGDTVVSTVMANLGLERALREFGVALLREPVGDRYVLEKMLDDSYLLGGEQSGHLIYLDSANTGDGILTALKMLDVMQTTGEPLSKLATIMSKSPQRLINVPVRARTPLETVPEIHEQAEQARQELGDEGRLVLRYSGTEAIARVMIEGLDKKQIDRLSESIATVIQEKLG